MRKVKNGIADMRVGVFAAVARLGSCSETWTVHQVVGCDGTQGPGGYIGAVDIACGVDLIYRGYAGLTGGWH